MKYKVGDKVRIKNLDWYNQNKDKDDNVPLIESTNGYYNFIEVMRGACGKVMTISSVNSDYYDMVEDAGEYYWTDDMIEGLVERNVEKYPYKIGDRVVLKGSNRCATITDLKYNSWGNLSYYIKIDNDKDISIDYPTNLLLPYNNKAEGLVKEKTKPKFKVGDRVITDTNMEGKIIENVEEGWYRVEFESYNNIPQPNSIVPEESMSLAEEDKGMDKLMDLIEYHSLKHEVILPDGYIFKDEKGNVINATKIVLEKKKKEYPKTYEECAKVLLDRASVRNDLGYKGELLVALQKLLVCRDAYWKIAGEEMGLGKPWKPFIQWYRNVILTFPTEEMRDAFYENFKELIESCKELL